MSKLAFLFCVAFIAKASGAALNSSNSEVISSKNIPTSSSSRNLTVVSNDAVKLDSISNLKNYIHNATTKNLARKRNEYLSTGVDLLENGTETMNVFGRELYDIYKRENDSVAEYYKQINSTEECFPPIQNLERNFHLHFKNVSDCLKVVFSYFSHYLTTSGDIYYNGSEFLEQLELSASTCESDECFKLKKDEVDNVVKEKLQDLASDHSKFVAGVPSNRANFTNCLNSDEVKSKYEQEVKEGFGRFKDCVAPGNKKKVV